MKGRRNLQPARHRIFPCTSKRANAFPMARKPPTHNAYAFRRESPDDPFRQERRENGYWIEIGYAWMELAGDRHRLFFDRLPTGGFSGHVFLSPVGVKPPEPEPQPERPAAGEG
jgi:hypothetical protein